MCHDHDVETKESRKQQFLWNETSSLGKVLAFLNKKPLITASTITGSKFLLLSLKGNKSFVFEQRLIILIVNTKARKFEIKRNSFAKF